jgi:hypothetical protein
MSATLKQIHFLRVSQFMSDKPVSDNTQQPEKPSFWQVVLSTLAAAIGVQSNKNRERDFTKGNIYTYALAGVIFTVIFVVAMILIVKTVLKAAGA